MCVFKIKKNENKNYIPLPILEWEIRQYCCCFLIIIVQIFISNNILVTGIGLIVAWEDGHYQGLDKETNDVGAVCSPVTHIPGQTYTKRGMPVGNAMPKCTTQCVEEQMEGRRLQSITQAEKSGEQTHLGMECHYRAMRVGYDQICLYY